MNVQQSDYAVMSISVRSQNWVGEMWVTCLVGQSIACFTCVWGGYISSLIFLSLQVLHDSSTMVCSKQSYGSCSWSTVHNPPWYELHFSLFVVFLFWWVGGGGGC